MPGYVIAESTHRDDEGLRQYRRLASASVARHGGRYLVRGQTPHPREGHWAEDRRIVVIEFPSIEAAHAWYDSPDYQAALATRSAPPTDRRLLFVDGTINP